jgi:hypothetical protein
MSGSAPDGFRVSFAELNGSIPNRASSRGRDLTAWAGPPSPCSYFGYGWSF